MSRANNGAGRHLLFKGTVGLLASFPLALWLSWLLMYGGLGPSLAPARDQVAMWLVVPLWAAGWSAAFMARSRGQCVAVFAVANALAFAAWWAMQ